MLNYIFGYKMLQTDSESYQVSGVIHEFVFLCWKWVVSRGIL